MKKYNIPIFIPHEGCPNDCVFCNQKKITGVQTSVTTEDVERIIDDYLKFLPKADRYAEVAFFGGSFTGLDLKVQEEFLKTAYKYKDYIDGVRMSTRPDYINDEVLKLAKEYNVRTIELGLQSADDEVLRMNGRGHTFADTIKASELIKMSGITLGLQMMIGMYGSNPEKDLKTAIETAKLKPSCVRIYPTLTLGGTKLETLYESGEYIPYDIETAISVTDKAMRIFEDKGIDIIRVGLHSDESLTEENNIVAGPYHPAFRELVLGRRQREKIEEEVIKNNLSNCEYIVDAPKNKTSEIIGHKRCNAVYFKEKYNIDLKISRA